MIYTIIVNANPLPEGGWDESITVEVEADSNPELVHVLGTGWTANYPFEGPADWCISALTPEIHGKVSQEMALKFGQLTRVYSHDGKPMGWVNRIENKFLPA